MPFTIAGEWIPEPTSKPKLPMKIIKEKRRGSYVTLLLNVASDEAQLKDLCFILKQRLACGGSLKEGRIELQGDQVEKAKAYFKTKK